MTNLPPPPDISPEPGPEQDASMQEWSDAVANAESDPDAPPSGAELAAQAREIPDTEPITEEEEQKFLSERVPAREDETGNLEPSRPESADIIRSHTGQHRPRLGYLSKKQREVGRRGSALLQATLKAHRPDAHQAGPIQPVIGSRRTESDLTNPNNYELFNQFADISQQIVDGKDKLDGPRVAADLIANTSDIDPKFVASLLTDETTMRFLRSQRIAQKFTLVSQFIDTASHGEGQSLKTVLQAMKEMDPRDERTFADRIAEAKTAKSVRKLLLAKAKEILVPSDK